MQYEMAEKKVSKLYDFSDDILVNIFSFLSSLELIPISKVCVRFNELCCRKAVVGHLDFCRCYELTEETLKSFLTCEIRCANIQVLDLNYCYWLPTSLLGEISKLKNLKKLHLLDCDVSVALLSRILSSLELDSLSWTWIHQLYDAQFNFMMSEDMYFVQIESCLSNLKHLELHLGYVFCFPRVNYMLQFCKNLETLTIYKSRCVSLTPSDSDSDSLDSFPPLTYLETFPRLEYDILVPTRTNCMTKLKKLSIKVDITPRDDEELYERMFSEVIAATSSLEEIWFSEYGSDVLGYCCDLALLTLPEILSLDAVSLSGLDSDSDPVLRDDLFYPDLHNRLLSGDVGQGHQMKWRKLSLDYSFPEGDVLFSIAQKCPLLENFSMRACRLDHFMTDTVLGLKCIAEHCPKITHLDLAYMHFVSATHCLCSALASLTNLRSLCISTNLLWKPTSGRSDLVSCHQPLQVHGYNNSGATVTRNCLLVLTEKCPHLHTLEIHGKEYDGEWHYECRSSSDEVPDLTLSCIFRWRRLRHLTLSCITNIRHGHFLFTILKYCQELKTLTLDRLGDYQSCFYIQHLIQGLPYANSLKDLRVFQKNLNLTSDFYRSLENCRMLERLYLNNVDVSAPFVGPVCQMVEELPKLTVLYIITNSAEAVCDDLLWRLKRKFQDDRPAFSCMVANEENDLSIFPSVHVREMIII